MKATIQIQESWLADTAQLQIRFDYDPEIISILKGIKGAHWLPAGRCWIVPGGVVHEKYLEEFFLNYDVQWYRDPGDRWARASAIHSMERTACYTTKEVQLFHDWMLQRRYSLNTIKVYAQAVDYFLRSQSHASGDLTTEDVEKFMREMVVRRGLSTSYQRQLINAIKLFYSAFLKSKMNIEQLILPRKDKKLPKVISAGEVQKILQSCVNQKHRAALLVLYGCGLRRSELISITINDINSSRELLHVRQSKGRKDRYVPLPAKLIEVLRGYYKVYRPQTYLFEGQGGAGTQWSAKSLEQVLRRAVKKSGIGRKVNLHMLRHSYATHQLEAGVNLRYIQEILGHSSPTTTQIYTHVTQESVRKISSPAERLDIW